MALRLTVAPHNERARRLYRSLGFAKERVMEEVRRMPDGEAFRLIEMELARPETLGDRPHGRERGGCDAPIAPMARGFTAH